MTDSIPASIPGANGTSRFPARSASHFVALELEALAESIGETLDLSDSGTVLGEAFVREVRPALGAGRVTTEDVVGLALVADALRIAEVAIHADGEVSEAEVHYAYPLASAAAPRLAQLRRYYDDYRTLSRAATGEFLQHHRDDTQLFGGGCPKTRWLGLGVVRRVALATGDREPFERYAELVVRLLEEIVGLESSHASQAQVRDHVEERLGLRTALQRVELELARDVPDARVRVFCSPEGPEVFHAVAHGNQVWRRDPLDVDSVHEDARRLYLRLLDRAASAGEGDGQGRVLLVLGEAGSGKTHLMRAFRNEAHARRLGYAAYQQMSSAADDYGRYLRVHLLESLEKPYDEPEVRQSGLMCLSDALLAAVPSSRAEARRRLQEAELSREETCDLVFELADEVVLDPRFRETDIDLIRALLFLQRREPPVHARVLKLLRGEPLSPYDRKLLGELAPKTRGEDSLLLVAQLGRLVERTGGGALVLLIDQLEDIFNLDAAKERFVRAMDVVRHVADNVPNALVVVSCLRDYYKELSRHLTRPVLDRIERNPDPVHLTVERSLPEVEAVVARRIGHLYEAMGVRPRGDDPWFPIPRAFLERLANLGTRDIFQRLSRFQKRCIEAGEIVAWEPLAAESIPAPAPGPDEEETQSLERRWNDFRLEGQPVPEEDEALAGLLAWALEAAAAEAGAANAVRARPVGDRVEIDVTGSEPRLAGITNKGSGGGHLGRQIEALQRAATAAGRVPLAVRSSDFGGRPGTKLAKILGVLRGSGGQRVVVEDSDWRLILAYRAFREQEGGQEGFDAWVRTAAPLGSVDPIRQLLDLEALGPGGSRDSAPDTGPPPEGAGSEEEEAAGGPGEPATEGPSEAGIDREPVRKPNLELDPKTLRIGTTLSVRSEPVGIDPQILRRHAAFLGSSGSGKTSLALHLIEQLAERGVPALLVDRKGDLAAYADPATWTAEETNPERRKRREELRDRVDVRLLTPGNPHGRPLRLQVVPEGLAGLASQERGQIARFAAHGLGAMMGYKGTQSDQTLLGILGKAIEVVGQLRSDQSLGLRPLIDLIHEEDPNLLAELGRLETPKHFKKLVEHLETLRLNHGALLEASGAPLRAESVLGLDRTDGRVPLTILSTKFLGDAKRIDFWVSQLLVELSRWCSRSPSDALQAVVLLDEADIYLPATRKPATKGPLEDLLKRARSAGLGILLATQNPGDLDYKGRDNIGTWWLGRVASPPAVAKMKPLLSDCRTDISGKLATAGVGEFFQVANGLVTHVKTERSLMDTTQLPEDRILELARAR